MTTPLETALCPDRCPIWSSSRWGNSSPARSAASFSAIWAPTSSRSSLWSRRSHAGLGAGPAGLVEVIARNKRSVSLNLRLPAGQELARELISRADVLIENFRPGTLEGWGLSPDALSAQNPRLIIVRMSGYGQTGPYSERPGFGGVAEAMGGWRRIVGEPDRPPSRLGVSIGDTLCATYGAMGVLAALHHRDLTGRGQVVDVALYEWCCR